MKFKIKYEEDIKRELLDEESSWDPGYQRWVKEETGTDLDVDAETDMGLPVEHMRPVKDIEPTIHKPLKIKTERTKDFRLNMEMDPTIDMELNIKMEPNIDIGLDMGPVLDSRLNIKMEPTVDTDLKTEMKQTTDKRSKKIPIIDIRPKMKMEPMDKVSEINLAPQIIKKPRLSVEMEMDFHPNVKIEPIVDVKLEEQAADVTEATKKPNKSNTNNPMKSKKKSTKKALTPVPCPICEVTYSHIGNMRRHIKQTHSTILNVKEDGLYSCDICNKTFPRKDYLPRHIATHSGKTVKCECGKVIKRGYMSQHKSLYCEWGKMHKGKYACNFCRKKYERKEPLERHVQLMHFSEYFCDFCNKGYPTKYDLTKHIMTHNVNLISRPFKCEECGKKYSLKHSLRKHQVLHSGVKPYCCKICRRTFYSKWGHLSHVQKRNCVTSRYSAVSYNDRIPL